ncbi:MAG: hypothetical protein JWM93_2471 [Frankiales bacterium]|nr:hypothetical protein [Frankiales bacterium]
MTTIVAVTNGQRVLMAADGRTVMSGDITTDAAVKILQFGAVGDIAAIGISGRTTLMHLVTHRLEFPKAPTHDTDLDRWAFDISEQIALLCVHAKPAVLDSDGGVDGNFLLAFRGRIWLGAEMCPVRATRGYEAIGSGREYALGALAAYKNAGDLATDPGECLRDAIRVAARFDANTGADGIHEVAL